MAKKGHYTDNPCVYIDDFNHPHLNIFRNFFKEMDLPKFQKLEDDYKAIYNVVIDNTDDRAESSDGSSTSHILPSWQRMASGTSSPYNYERSMQLAVKEISEHKLTFFEKIKKLFSKKKVPVDVTFDLVKASMLVPKTKDMEESVKKIEKLYEFMKKSGQYLQADKVKTYGNILSYELTLMKNGIEKYLTEEDIIDFMLKADKGVSITFLRHFSNILPMDVAKKKMDADKLKVFDNYAIMYYDPGVELFRWQEEADRQLARDPIMFGLIDGSNKLYYVCDWTYEEDDLTMEKVELAIGRKANLIKDAKAGELDIKVADAIAALENILPPDSEGNIL